MSQTSSHDNALPFDIVVMAASAGGLNAITKVLSELPADFPLPILVVQHLDPGHRSHLAEIISRRVVLQAKEAQEGDTLRAHTVYLAPPNMHLLISPELTISLGTQNYVQYVRPSADLLFESAAARFGKRVIAVVLSGSGQDGARGMRAVSLHGGMTIAQNRATSDFFGMPGAAIATGLVNFVLPLNMIAGQLVALVRPPDPAA